MTAKIAGIVFAGGEGTRLGVSEKPLVCLGQRRLIDFVLERVHPQVDQCALGVWRASLDGYREFEEKGVCLIADPFPERIGPLGGLVAGMRWAMKLGDMYKWLATFPGDSPFLAKDLVATLLGSSSTSSTRPLVATDSSGVQPLCALWPISLGRELCEAAFAGSFESVREALSEFGCVHAPLLPDCSFFNVNTPDDLAYAERRLLRGAKDLEFE